jgi:hypothetical protein
MAGVNLFDRLAKINDGGNAGGSRRKKSRKAYDCLPTRNFDNLPSRVRHLLFS